MKSAAKPRQPSRKVVEALEVLVSLSDIGNLAGGSSIAHSFDRYSDEQQRIINHDWVELIEGEYTEAPEQLRHHCECKHQRHGLGVGGSKGAFCHGKQPSKKQSAFDYSGESVA